MAGINVARFRARKLVDEVAGEARLRYVTDAPFQALIYLIKKQEADALALDGLAPAPHLRAEADALGVTVASRAQLTLNQWSSWNDSISPQIEAARLVGRAAINAATTVDDVRAAAEAAVAALNAI